MAKIPGTVKKVMSYLQRPKTLRDLLKMVNQLL